MSFVLILMSDDNGRPPAVLGGYKLKMDAAEAGKLATRWETNAGNYDVMPFYNRFMVIPGIDEYHMGSVHSAVHRAMHGEIGTAAPSKLYRITHWHPEDEQCRAAPGMLRHPDPEFKG